MKGLTLTQGMTLSTGLCAVLCASSARVLAATPLTGAATATQASTLTMFSLGTVLTVTLLALFACLTLRERFAVMTVIYGVPSSVLLALSVWSQAPSTELRPHALLVLCVVAIELTLSLKELVGSAAVKFAARAVQGFALVTLLAAGVSSTLLSELSGTLATFVSWFSAAVFVLLGVWGGITSLTARRYIVFVAVAWLVLAAAITVSAVLKPDGADMFAYANASTTFDAGLALSFVLLALAFMHKTMRSHTRWASALAVSKNNDRMLTLERSQREFSREVDDFLGTVSSNDFEEVVLTSFLTHLDRVIPAAASAVAISHRGQMRLVTRFPEGDTKAFSSVLSTRENLLQGVCLSDKAAVLHSEVDGLEIDNQSLSTLCIVPVPPYRNEWACVVLARTGEQDFQVEELRLVKQFAEHVRLSFENANKFNRFRRQAETDMLTGLMNRRAVSARAERAFKKARSLKNPLSFLFIDIDNFKAVNDCYGHEAGDRALHRVAQICQRSVRDEDTVGRYGGEEFIAILPGTGEENAHVVAERIRKSVAESPLNVSGDTLAVTVSVGISEYHSRFDSTRDMLNAADRALYAAKRDGRNRVVHHLRIVRGGLDS